MTLFVFNRKFYLISFHRLQTRGSLFDFEGFVLSKNFASNHLLEPTSVGDTLVNNSLFFCNSLFTCLEVNMVSDRDRVISFNLFLIVYKIVFWY